MGPESQGVLRVMLTPQMASEHAHITAPSGNLSNGMLHLWHKESEDENRHRQTQWSSPDDVGFILQLGDHVH